MQRPALLSNQACQGWIVFCLHFVNMRLLEYVIVRYMCPLSRDRAGIEGAEVLQQNCGRDDRSSIIGLTCGRSSAASRAAAVP